MSEAFSQCLIIRSLQETEQALHAVAQALQKVNRELGTAFTRIGKSAREDAADYTWSDATTNGATRVIWCDDAAIPAQYLEVIADSCLLLPAIVSLLRESLPLMTQEELLRDSDPNRSAVLKPGAITRLALATRGPFQEAVADRVARALRHESPAVRRQAQMAAFLLNWKELRPILKEALEHETESALRLGLEFLADRSS